MTNNQPSNPTTPCSNASILISLAVLTLAGCHEPCICVSDGVANSGSKILLSANVDRHPSRDRCVGIPGIDVTFYDDDNRKLGIATTDQFGIARLTCDLPPGTTRFRSEAFVERQRVTGEGLIFSWPKGRTVIICDIDGTISDTHYRELVFNNEDTASAPIVRSAEVLQQLNQRFGLIYLTARPAFLREKTHRWLDKHGFPRAPLISAPSLSESITPQTFKAMKIHDLQANLKDIRIGIGDAKSDSEAYAMENLLTLMIDHNDAYLFRSHAIVMQDWSMLLTFIDANRAVLEDPAKLQSALDNQNLIMRPLLKYRPRRGLTIINSPHLHDPIP